MEYSINTIKARLKLAFPNRDEWKKLPAIFTGKSLLIAGHQVMQKWESNYMKSLAAIAVRNGGRVLEVGYGMGISARFIDSLGRNKVTQHYIIEAHPDIANLARKNYEKEIKLGKVVICEGFWEDVVDSFENDFFEGILFDTYPLTPDELHKNHYNFFKTANRILKKDGVLTYYSDESEGFSDDHIKKLMEVGFKEYSFKACKVSPPKDCIYWDKKVLIAPMVVK
ncbi:MAG: hypothetical protein WCP24_03420 [bacterium]